jgi:serine/threonine-protein kinase
MAPERLAGRPATVESDLYSVGVVLYEALSGARPFPAATPIGMVHAIDQASPPPLSGRCPGVDAALIAAVERAMAKNPEDRFASAAEMAAALQARSEPPAGAADADPTVMVGHATAIFDAPPMSVAPDTNASLGAAAPPDLASSPVPATSSVPAASPVQHARHAPRRLPRRRLLALLAVAGLALALFTAAFVGDDNTTSPGETPAATGPPTADTGIPRPLDDALRELEKRVR